jgi:hypothetical protein
MLVLERSSLYVNIIINILCQAIEYVQLFIRFLFLYKVLFGNLVEMTFI